MRFQLFRLSLELIVFTNGNIFYWIACPCSFPILFDLVGIRLKSDSTDNKPKYFYWISMTSLKYLWHSINLEIFLYNLELIKINLLYYYLIILPIYKNYHTSDSLIVLELNCLLYRRLCMMLVLFCSSLDKIKTTNNYFIKNIMRNKNEWTLSKIFI